MVSILHRITGVGLFLVLPLGIALLDVSLRGEDGFTAARQTASSGWARALLVLIGAGYAFHLAAGIRLLAFDMGLGIRGPTGRATAWAVLAIGAVVLTGLILWGVIA